MIFKPLTLLTLSIIASSANATQKDIVPICLSEDDNTVTYLDAEKKSVPISLVPMFLIDGDVGYGFDAANVTEEEYANWKNQCNENATLMAYLAETKNYIPFKTELNTYSNPFINRVFDLHRPMNIENIQNPKMHLYESGLRFLTKLAAETEKFPEVANYLAKTNDLTLHFQNSGIPNHTHNGSEQIVLNYNLFNKLYETTDGFSSDFYSFYRTLTHQLLHEALPLDTAERDIIDMSNKILTAMNFPDKPRALYDKTDLAPTYQAPTLYDPEQPIEATSTGRRTKRAVALPERTPDERLHDFFYRDPIEFASDPSVYLLAFGIAGQITHFLAPIILSPVRPPVVVNYGSIRPITPPPSPTDSRLTAYTGSFVTSSASSFEIVDGVIEAAEATASLSSSSSASIDVTIGADDVVIEAVPEVIVTKPVEDSVPPAELREIPRPTGRLGTSEFDTSSRADRTSVSSDTSRLGPELYETSDLSSIGSGEEGMLEVSSETHETSLSATHETSITSEGSGAGMLTAQEKQRFLVKIERDLRVLDAPINRKIAIQRQLQPNGHFVSHAPLSIRQYLAGSMTLESLVDSIPDF